MNKEEIYKELLSIMKEVFQDFDESIISYETKIFSDLKLDSISLLYLAILIEKKFDYKLTNANINPNTSVKDLINNILSK